MDSVSKALLMVSGGASGPPQGQISYDSSSAGTAGSLPADKIVTFNYVVPAGVTSICAVCVGPGGGGSVNNSGGGGGGGGGGLGWANNISVTSGETLVVEVGRSALSFSSAASRLMRDGTVLVSGGAGLSASTSTGGNGGTYTGGGGGSGGRGGNAAGSAYPGAGAGAGGYSGNGGAARSGISSDFTGLPGNGGGAGAGTNGTEIATHPTYKYTGGGGGGGVGLFGQGSSGAESSTTRGSGGNGGSGGSNGGSAGTGVNAGNASSGYGGGGGGAGFLYNDNTGVYSGRGTLGQSGYGAVRIIWGAGRAFPSTNTGNV